MLEHGWNLTIGAAGQPPASLGRFVGSIYHPWIPNPCEDVAACNYTLRSGMWSDPGVWSSGVPTNGQDVIVAHAVTLDPSEAAFARHVLVYPGASLNLTGGELHVTTLLIRGTIHGAGFRVYWHGQLDPIRDPGQWWGGLVATTGSIVDLGNETREKEPFLRLSSAPMAGDAVLNVSGSLAGWEVGDQVIVPQSHKTPSNTKFTFSDHRCERRTIVAIDGQAVTLDSPLAFDHPASPRFGYVCHVLNMTRTGGRFESGSLFGHCLIDEAALSRLQDLEFVRMGRTQNIEHDSPEYDSEGNCTHVGTNPYGRYPLDQHHVTEVPFHVGNCVFDGGDEEHIRKWAVSVHNADDGIVADCIAYNFGGCGFVTEDGDETDNTFENCFACLGWGDPNHEFRNSRGPTSRPGVGTRIRHDGSTYRVDRQFDGREATGFWFRSPRVRVRNCVAAAIMRTGQPESSYGFKWQCEQTHSLLNSHGEWFSAWHYPITEFRNCETYGGVDATTYWWISANDNWAAPDPQWSYLENIRCWNMGGYGFFGYQAAKIEHTDWIMDDVFVVGNLSDYAQHDSRWIRLNASGRFGFDGQAKATYLLFQDCHIECNKEEPLRISKQFGTSSVWNSQPGVVEVNNLTSNKPNRPISLQLRKYPKTHWTVPHEVYVDGVRIWWHVLNADGTVQASQRPDFVLPAYDPSQNAISIPVSMTNAEALAAYPGGYDLDLGGSQGVVHFPPPACFAGSLAPPEAIPHPYVEGGLYVP